MSKIKAIIILISLATQIIAENSNGVPTFECISSGKAKSCIIHIPITSKDNPNFKVSHPEPQKVKNVEIKGGNLAVFTSAVCDYFPNLIDITLDDTNVEELDDNALITCTKLQIVALEGGKVKEIPSKFFKNSQQIEEIYIADLPIKKIDPDQFHGLPKLKVLCIVLTQIEKFPLVSISSDKISGLLLYSNNLKDFPAEDYKKRFPKAGYVGYNDNDINCSRVQEMNDFLKKQGVWVYKLKLSKPREEKVGEVGGITCVP